MTPTEEYNAALLVARNGLGAIHRQAEERLIALLAQALLDIVRDAGTGKLTHSRAMALSRNIRGQLARLGVDMRDTLTALAGEAERAMIQAHVAGAGAIGLQQSFGGVSDMLNKLLVDRRGFADSGRGYSAMFQAVISRNLQPIAVDIDEYLFKSIQRGTTNREVARELALMASKGDPELHRIIRDRIKGGVPDAELKRAKSMVSDFKRIAVHEINSAHDEADKASAIVNPIIQAVKWTTSGRHDGLPSAPDACDVAEDMDVYGMGPGVYPPEYAPSLLHPHCLCIVSKILLPVDQWAAGRQPPPSSRLQFTEANVGAIMGRRLPGNTSGAGGRSVTPKHIKAQWQVLNERIGGAFDAWNEQAGSRTG